MTNKARSREERTRGEGADLVDPLPYNPRNSIQRTGGRPELYEAAWVETACAMAQTGATDVEIAKELGISTSNLYKTLNRYPKFREALRGAKDVYDERVEASLARRALGYDYETEKAFANGTRVRVIEHQPPDTTAQIFWLKNRRPQTWRDRKEHELVVPDNSQQPEDADTRQLALAALALMQEAAYDADLMIEGTANAEENADGVNQPRRAHQEPESAGLEGDPDFDEAFELDE